MKKLLIALGLSFIAGYAHAQTATPIAIVVGSCGTATYVEGRSAPASIDLLGNLCISGTLSAETSATATENAPSYLEGSASALSQNLTGDLRTISKQSGTWTVQPGNIANTTAWLVTGTDGIFPATQSGTWTVQPGNTANTTAWKVTGSGGTFPATQSGTWTVQPGNTANTTAWLVTGTGGTFPATQSGTWTVQPGNTANTTAWLVTGTGGTFPATQSGTWTSRVVGNGGATVDSTVGAGTAPTNMIAVGGLYNSAEISPSTGQAAALQLDSKGRLRQVIMDAAGNSRGANVNASNQLSVSVDAIVANQSVNLAQIAGTTTSVGNGTAGNGVQRVTVASDNSAVSGFGVGATGSSVPTNAVYQGNSVGGNLTGQIGCGSSVVYDASTSGSTELVALTSNQTVYVCGYSIMAGGTVNVKLVYGTGSACATGTTGMTPAWQLTAQSGLVDGSPIYRGLKTATSNALCINTSGAVAVQAVVYYTKF